MIRLVIHKRIYSYERIIFPDDAEESSADIIRYMRFVKKPSALDKCKWEEYRTPVTDLLGSAEEIRSNYSKEVRYEVRRAGRENIQFTMIESGQIDDSLIDDLHEKYSQFCDVIAQPHLKHNFDKNEIKTMASNGNITVSRADHENGWIYHVYQTDGSNAMLWFSFSDHRKENSNKSMAGWANRGLHDHDIMYFKDHGYASYDWGNISSESEPNQIDKFKMSFGGKIISVNSCFVGNTLKGRALIKLREYRNGR